MAYDEYWPYDDTWTYDLSTGVDTKIRGDDMSFGATQEVNCPDKNDIWTFDLNSLVWKKHFSVDNGGYGVPNIDFPSARSSSFFAYADNGFYIFGGINEDPWMMGKDFWHLDFDALESGKTNRAILAFDVSTPSMSTPDDNGILTVSAFATGDDGAGSPSAGLNVYQWNPNTSSFVLLFSNSATSRATGNWTGPVNLTFRDGQNKVYLLFQGTPRNTTAVPAVFDIDFSTIQLTVPYH